MYTFGRGMSFVDDTDWTLPRVGAAPRAVQAPVFDPVRIRIFLSALGPSDLAIVQEADFYEANPKAVLWITTISITDAE